MNTTDSGETLEQFIDQTGVTFPTGWDVESSYDAFKAADEGLSPFPLDVLVGRDGVITWLSREYDAGALLAAVQQALDAPPPDGPAPVLEPPTGGGSGFQTACTEEADCDDACPPGFDCGCFELPSGKRRCRVPCPDDGICPELKGKQTVCHAGGFCTLPKKD